MHYQTKFMKLIKYATHKANFFLSYHKSIIFLLVQSISFTRMRQVISFCRLRVEWNFRFITQIRIQSTFCTMCDVIRLFSFADCGIYFFVLVQSIDSTGSDKLLSMEFYSTAATGFIPTIHNTNCIVVARIAYFISCSILQLSHFTKAMNIRIAHLQPCTMHILFFFYCIERSDVSLGLPLMT